MSKSSTQLKTWHWVVIVITGALIMTPVVWSSLSVKQMIDIPEWVKDLAKYEAYIFLIVIMPIAFILIIRSHIKGYINGLFNNEAEDIPARQQMTRPTSIQLIQFAILFNDGEMDEKQLAKMVGMTELILDRLFEHGDVTKPSSNEIRRDKAEKQPTPDQGHIKSS